MLEIVSLRTAVVGPISLAVGPGRCAAIAGPSGSGKSLFLRMVADLDPHEGTVRLGALVRDAVPAPAWRRQVVYVAAEAGWWAETAQAHFSTDAIPQAQALATRLALDPAAFERPIRLLSTGERQRLGLIRALVLKPKVLLLDEPTSALDPQTSLRAEALIADEKARGTIVLLVTHDAGQAERLGDARYAMDEGRLIGVPVLRT